MIKFKITLFLVFIFSLSFGYSDEIGKLRDSIDYYKSINQFSKSLEFAKQSLILAEEDAEVDDIDYINSLASIAENFFYLGNLDSAIYYQLILLEKVKSLQPPDKEALTSAMHNLGSYYSSKGQFKIALELTLESLSIKKEMYQELHEEIASSYNQLGQLYNRLGEFEEAENYYKQALEIRRELEPEVSLNLAISINNLAVFYRRLGRAKEARPLYEETLAIFRELYDEDNPTYATFIGNIAVFYYLQGNYREAEPLLLEAYEMRKRLLNADHPDLAMMMNNLGAFYEKIGNKKEAYKFYVDALEMRRRIFQGDHPDLALSMSNLAIFLLNQQKIDEAKKLHIESLEMKRRIYPGDHQSLSLSIGNVAILNFLDKEFEKAEQLSKEAVDMNRRIFKNESYELALSIQSLGVIYYKLGRYEEAELFLLESFELFKKMYNNTNTNLVWGAIAIGGLYAKMGKYESAEKYFRDVNNIIDNILDSYFYSLTEEGKFGFYQTISHYNSFFYEYAIARHNEKPELLVTMYDNIIKRKGLLLNSYNQITQFIIESNDAEITNLYNQWRQEKDYIAKFYGMSKAQIEESKVNLDSLINNANLLERHLNTISSEFQQTLSEKTISFDEVRESLNDNEAAVEIARIIFIDNVLGNDSISYIAFIVKKNSEYPELVFLPNAEELENTYFDIYKAELRNDNDNKQSYSNYWTFIAEKLDGVKKVYISPDGIYNLISFSTLKNPKTNKYLDQEVDFVLVTNTKDIVKIRNKAVRTNNNHFVLFGDPNFDFSYNDIVENYNAEQNNQAEVIFQTQNLPLDSISRGSINLTPLPWARDEVNEIADIINTVGGEKTIYLWDEAREENLKSINSPRVLHLATHGYFLNDIERTGGQIDFLRANDSKSHISDNPLLRSMLFFAGANNTIQALDSGITDINRIEDGIFTAYEAQNLDLYGTELVVLAACETGLGEIVNGEGVYGLQRAFIQAGVETVIMSLWKANDKATKELMVHFYSEWLSGKSKRESFNIAKQKTRENYRYPLFWGAYIMVGGE